VSLKKASENRVWYAYPGQVAGSRETGGLQTARPATTGRVLAASDGGSQFSNAEYNSLGKVTRSIDALGRETDYEYDTNGIDLLTVKQVNAGSPGGYDLLSSYSYNPLYPAHLPATVTDASGSVTTYTYNAQGQVTSVVTPATGGLSVAQRTTTYSYTNGYLDSVTAPDASQTLYTYDARGRMRTVTDSEGYTVTTDYDDMDRPTTVTYPDGTYEQTIYDRLDARRHRDRLGRWTQTDHDAMRRVVSIQNALGQTTSQVWCQCGSLDQVVDANGNATTWERDTEGRVAKEVRADGAATKFTYEPASGRLSTRTDALGQVTTYTYDRSDNLTNIAYTNALHTTPSVGFTYDTVYNRQTTMTDGTGTTSYTYYPATGQGANKLHTVDGPLADDAVTYTYDELGRVKQRGLASFSSTFNYDLLGRLSTLASPVGTFDWSYFNSTGRPETVTYPNGQDTHYAYFGGAADPSNDPRLKQIKHEQTANGTVLSQFDYTYDAVGNISTWRQQLGTAQAKTYTFGYDNADQLTSGVVSGPSPLPVPSRYVWAYDAAGNRLSEARDDVPTGSTYNNRNQLLSQAGSGVVPVGGSVSEFAAVTANGAPTQLDASNNFSGTTAVPGGTSNLTVVATDASGNERTNTYTVPVGGASQSFAYDPNGNLTSDGTRTYQWDAENRLVAVLQGATTLASFTYDGKGRRTQKAVVGATHTYVYDDLNIVEERASSGQTLDYVQAGLDRPLAQRDQSSVVTYFVADHLGSIAQATNSIGTVALTREYDPWGNLLQGSTTGGYAFTGREWDPEIGLYYYRARYYNSLVGRFLAEDTGRSEFHRGNLYSYVANRSIVGVDPTGHYTLAPSAQPYSLDIRAAMMLLHLKLERQPGQCCVKWFEKGGASVLAMASPGSRPEVRVEHLPRGQGDTWFPFTVMRLDVNLLTTSDIQGGSMHDMCHTSSVILHEFGHAGGKDDRPGFVNGCTYDCLDPRGSDDR
jgi:RHS repeat-associated protein